MTTLTDIIDFMRSGTKPFREWESGVARRATDPNAFGEALADGLSMDPRTGDLGVIGIGAIHGQNSRLFPEAWRGQDGKARQMMDDGASPREIWDASVKDTGFGIYPQHLYKDGKLQRTDLKMNVPDINLEQGARGIDDIGKIDSRQNYPATDFRTNLSMEAGYPAQYNAGSVQMADNAIMLDEPMSYNFGKYGDKGDVGYRINKEADYIPATEDSLLPRFAAMDQGIIQEAERFAPGGITKSPYAAGNVEQRAVEDEFRTVLDLRASGMDNREIINYLSKNPIFDRLDTPDILQEVIPRQSSIPRETSGRIPSRYKKQKPEIQYEPYEVIKEVIKEVPQPAIPRYDIEKVRFPGGEKVKKKRKKTIMESLRDLINYVR